MHFQYIKCWLDKGFNKLDKINKKSRYFLLIYNSGIWIWVLLQGTRSENMWLVRTLKFEWKNAIQNVFYWKRMANVLTRSGGRKRIQVSTFVVRMLWLNFSLWRRFYVLLAVDCLWMIKLNKTIICLLVYADTIKASLYFQLKWYFSNIKVYYKKGVVIFCDLNFMKTAELRNWH